MGVVAPLLAGITGPGSSAGGCAAPDGRKRVPDRLGDDVEHLRVFLRTILREGTLGRLGLRLGWRVGVVGGGGDSAAAGSGVGSETDAVGASGLMGAFVSGSIIVAGSTPWRRRLEGILRPMEALSARERSALRPRVILIALPHDA